MTVIESTVLPELLTVITGKNDDCIVGQSVFFQGVQDSAHPVIDFAYHRSSIFLLLRVVFQKMLQILRKPSYGAQWIAYFVGDTGSQPADRVESVGLGEARLE